MKKITVVGAGNVGATTALYLEEMELGDVVLVDVVDGLPNGKALDLFESSPIRGRDVEVVGSSDFSMMKGSDIVVLTAGFPRKPGMSRTDLLKSNMDIVKGVSEKVREFAPNSFLFVVTNPLDVMAYLASKITGFGKRRVMGMAGVLDSARFRTFVAMELGVSVADTSCMVLGGHGDSMVPLPRFSCVSGIPITELLPADRIDAIVKRTRDGGGEIVSLLKTGSAFYAPASSVTQMVEAIVKDKKRILPASVLLEGEYGMKGIFLGVPVKLGAKGVEEVIELKLTPEELGLLKKSGDGVKASIEEMESLL